MRRILFLDDDPIRRQWALLNFVPWDVFVQSETASEAITALGSIDFHEVYLDHDLGGEVYVDSSLENCGMAVVRWIVANRPKIGKIVCHSMNTPAGNEMAAKLTEAGYEAVYHSFYNMVRGM